MEPKEAARQAGAAARLALHAIEKIKVSLLRDESAGAALDLAEAVHALAPRLGPKEAGALMQLALEARGTARDTARTARDVTVLRKRKRVVAVVASRMEPQDAARQEEPAVRLVLEEMGRMDHGPIVANLADTATVRTMLPERGAIPQRGGLLALALGNVSVP